MPGSDIRKLLGKLSQESTKLLDQAAGFCLTRTHYQITIEHILLKAIEDGTGDVLEILRHFDVDPGKFERLLLEDVSKFKSGNSGRPAFSESMLEMVEQAWTLASINLNESRIRSGHLLLALVSQPGYLTSYDYGEPLEAINAQELSNKFHEITRDSTEGKRAAIAPSAKEDGTAAISDESYLGQFTTDFTGMAAAGKIDPIFWRDHEIREMVNILNRRRKNNPICVGEPGVGKTAVVEGLALRIVEGDVPDQIKGVTLRGLDMGLLQAGAGVKGEFEKRLKGVIDEVKSSEVPIIMFIDEAHTMIGAGGSAGGSDAANLLKPALARGELRTIAATTWTEYKKYFEKDPALARRFQLVKLDEPSVPTTIDILRGLKPAYSKAHNVTILDEAIVESSRLSSRYISGRQMPDKAVDLLDTASARVSIGLTAKPAVIDDLERRIGSIDREIDSLEAERSLSEEQTESLAKAKAEKIETAEHVETLVTQWNKEKELIQEIWTAAEEGAVEKEDAARAKLKDVQGGEGITEWTGIPLSKMVADEAETVLALDKILRKKIKGQDWGMDVLAEGIRASKAGVKPPETPIGVFLFVGPSGVGKTETALTITEELFGGERFVTSINMSEFQEKHTVSKLVGSPPGYVGYGEGGILTEAIRQRPYSVVLLDETEKAHPDVLNLFYQVFDKGIMTDGEGREIDCKNILFILTSNLATATITKMCETPVPPEADELISAIRPELNEFFRPALLARMTVVPFGTLPEEVIREITVLKLNKL
ncbi:MAG: AAA family ATPase, partial [Deltaproteobacteria bacterium]|nr:AAA family ATPase [Deltaproteobacteria bacterium]